MEIKVYIDVLLLINFVMNSVLLWLTGLLLKKEKALLRRFAASAVGAVYAAVAFFVPLPVVLGAVVRLGISFLMLLIAFRPDCFSVFCRQVIVFYLVSFVLGGAGFALIYFTRLGARLGAVISGGTLYLNIPVYFLAAACAAGWLILRTAFAVSQKMRNRSRLLYPVCVVYRGRKAFFTGFYDTGNFLKERQTGRSVLIAEWDTAKQLFPNAETVLDAVQEEDTDFVLIHASGVGADGVIPAFLPDEILRTDEEERPVSLAYIGLVERCLDRAGTYNLILPNDFEGAIFDEDEYLEGYQRTHQDTL